MRAHLLAAALVVPGSLAVAQISVEPLLDARRAAAAVAVGDVLVVAGGAVGNRGQDTVWAVGTADDFRWKSLAPLSGPRIGPAAVADRGAIVIAGGNDGQAPVAGVERLADLRKLWENLPSMTHARAGLALYADDGVLLAAGGREATGITGACETLGKRDREWRPCNRVPVPTAYPAYASFEGEDWLIGGVVRRDGVELPTDAVWIYERGTGLWRQGPKLPAPLSHGAAVALPKKIMIDGQPLAVMAPYTILVAGGRDRNGSPSPAVLAYDRPSNSWTRMTALPTPRAEAAAALWRGNLSVVGGWNGSEDGLALIEFYGFDRRSWSSIQGKTKPTDPIAMTIAAERRPTTLGRSEGYDFLPADASLTAPRWGAAHVEYMGKHVLLGGADKGRYLNFVEALEPGTFEWRAMAPMRRARAGLAVATNGKKIFATGGSDQGGPTDFAEVYDPDAHDWFPIAPMLKARSGHALVIMGGLVCAWGGVGRDGPEPGVECWDGKKWRMGEEDNNYQPAAPVWDAASTQNGRSSVRLFGGRTTSGGAVRLSQFGAGIMAMSVETPGVQTVHIGRGVTVPIPTPRTNAAAAYFTIHRDKPCFRQPGDIFECGEFNYVAGGFTGGGEASDKLEVFDDMQWVTASPMPTPRASASAFFRDGLFFVVGGKDSSGNALDVVEVFDPKRNRWATANRRAPPGPGAVAEALPPVKARFPVRPHDLAVVIGIEKYRGLPEAAYAEKDAAGYRSEFLSLGVPEENVVLLTGSKASRNDVVKYIEEWLPSQVRPDSRVFVAFSGHGAPKPDDGSAYLVPWDGDASFLKTTAYPLDEMLGRLNRLKAAKVFVILDSCFSGAGGRSVIAQGIRPLVTEGPRRTFSRLTIFGASQPNQIAGSSEGGGHGLFTFYVLNGLDGAADADGDGHVTAAELHGYARQRVIIDARKGGREQVPTLDAPDPGIRIY